MRVRHNLKDRVIAISSNKIENTQPRIKGNVYIVDDIIYCSKCGDQLINIGYESKRGNLLCGCGKSQFNQNKMWTYSKEFIPITKEYLKKMELEENYEFCIMIKKELEQLG